MSPERHVTKVFPSLVTNSQHHLWFGISSDEQAYPYSGICPDFTSSCTMPPRGKMRPSQVPQKVVNSAGATVTIVSQIPTQRFRYNNEGRTGRRNQNRAFLELKPNFGGPHTDYECMVFCVCDVEHDTPHPNALVGKDCKHGVYHATMKLEKGVLRLPHLQIERKKKGDVDNTWGQRAEQLPSPYKEKCQHLGTKKFSTSKVRLFVNVTAKDSTASAYCLSGVITSEKEGIQVDIHALSHYSASASGGETIYIMTTEQGPDVKPGDFEVSLSNGNWTSAPHVLAADDILYKKVIKYTVPPYCNQHISDVVTVSLILSWKRSNQQVAMDFQYRPEPGKQDIVGIDRRQQLKRPVTSHFTARDGPPQKAARLVNYPTVQVQRTLRRKLNDAATTEEEEEEGSQDFLAQSPHSSHSSRTEADYAAQVISQDDSSEVSSQSGSYQVPASGYEAMSYGSLPPHQLCTEDVGEARTYTFIQAPDQPSATPVSLVGGDAGAEREEAMEVQTSQSSQYTELQPMAPVDPGSYFYGKAPWILPCGKTFVTLYPMETSSSPGKQGLQYTQAQMCSEDSVDRPAPPTQSTPSLLRGKRIYEEAPSTETASQGASPTSSGQQQKTTSASLDSAGGKVLPTARAVGAPGVGKGKSAHQGKVRMATSDGRVRTPPQSAGKPGNIPTIISSMFDADDRSQDAARGLGSRGKVLPEAPSTSSSSPQPGPQSSGGVAVRQAAASGREAESTSPAVVVKSEAMDNLTLPSSLPSFNTGLALTTSLPSIPLDLNLKLPSDPALPSDGASSGPPNGASLPAAQFDMIPKLPTLPSDGSLTGPLNSMPLPSMNLTSMDIEQNCGQILKLANEPGS